MRLTVTVVPSARTTRVEHVAATACRVLVNAPPRQGRANQAVIGALAAHFGVPKTRVRILHGQSGRRKVVEIAGI